MKTEDQRDDRIAGLLDEAAQQLQPKPDVASVLRHGSRRRAARSTATLLAVAVFVGGIGWAGFTIRDNHASAAWRPYGSTTSSPWAISYPADWHVQKLSGCGNASSVQGAIFTNTTFAFRNPKGQTPGCGDRLVLAGFPQDGVAVVIQPQGEMIGALPGPLLDTPFPIRIGQLVNTSSIVGGPHLQLLGIAVKGDQPLFLSTYTGTAASDASRAEIARTVASLRVRGETRWVRQDVGDSGASIQAPSDWHVVTEKGGGVLITSYVPHVNRGACPIHTVRLLRGMSPVDAMIWIPPLGSGRVPVGAPSEPYRVADAEVVSRDLSCHGVHTPMTWLDFGNMVGGVPVRVDAVYGFDYLRTDAAGIVPEILASLRFPPSPVPALGTATEPIPRNTPPGA